MNIIITIGIKQINLHIFYIKFLLLKLKQITVINTFMYKRVYVQEGICTRGYMYKRVYVQEGMVYVQEGTTEFTLYTRGYIIIMSSDTKRQECLKKTKQYNK